MVKIKELQAFPKHQSHKVVICNSQNSLSISTCSVRKLVRYLLSAYAVRPREIVIYFVSRPKIQALHKRFFQDPSATDCITLPYNPPHAEADFLGEIFICPEVACTYAKRNALDPYQELTLYLVHGFLHLMGFKDYTPRQQEKMRQEEAKCLQELPFLTPLLR